MKKVAAVFILSFFLFACDPPEIEPVQIVPENTEKKEASEKTDTSKILSTEKENSTDATARVAKNTKPLLIARGSEPGWYAEFFADHVRLLIDNGTDSLNLSEDFSNINKDKTYKSEFITTVNKNNTQQKNTLTISIDNKPCTEEGSGEKREKSISIKYNNKNYKGCASANL